MTSISTPALVVGLLALLVLLVLAAALFLSWFCRDDTPASELPNGDWPAATTLGRTAEFPVLIDNRTLDEQAADVQKKIDEIRERISQ